LRSGDVVRMINGEAVLNSEDFQEKYLLLTASAGETIYLELIRSGHPYFAILKQNPAP
jgi:hypothetical protein